MYSEILRKQEDPIKRLKTEFKILWDENLREREK